MFLLLSSLPLNIYKFHIYNFDYIVLPVESFKRRGLRAGFPMTIINNRLITKRIS